jgi:hypothetical protein
MKRRIKRFFDWFSGPLFSESLTADILYSALILIVVCFLIILLASVVLQP